MWVEMLQNDLDFESSETKAMDLINSSDGKSVDDAVKNSNLSEDEKSLDGDSNTITSQDGTENEQEQKEKQRQRIMYELDNVGIDLSLSTWDLPILQKAIDSWVVTDAWSRTWEKNGSNYNINRLLENWLNNTTDLSDADIAAYKNIVDQITWGEYKGNEKIYDALAKKEFDIIFANVQWDKNIVDKVYTQYLSTWTNTQDLLNLSYADKATSIINQIDPARLENFNTMSFKQNLINTGIFTDEILNSSLTINNENFSIYGNYADEFTEKMKDVNSYSDTEKSNLAFMLIALKPLTSVEKANKVNNSQKTFWQVQKALLDGYQIVDGIDTIKPPTDTKNWTISKDLFISYSEQIQELRHDDMLSVYKSFYAPWNEIPPMSPVNVAAVGDLSSTMWFKIPNYGREYFGYDIEQQNTQVNQVFFGLKKDAPMEIYMEANWLNQLADGSWWMTFNMEFKKSPNSPENFIIKWIYRDNGQGPELTILDNPWNINVIKNWKDVANIVIPSQYNWYNITLTQQAGKYMNGAGFDETNLNISIENGRLGWYTAPEENWSADQTVQYPGWSADMPWDQQKQMKQSIDDIAYYAYRSVSEEIPMTVSSGVNDWKITWSLDEYKTFSADHITNPKLKEAWTTYSSLIDNADDASLQFPESWDDAQDNAQKVLAKRRFINALTMIQDSPDMLKLVDSWKIKIVPSYLFNQKAASISVDVTQFVAKK